MNFQRIKLMVMIAIFAVVITACSNGPKATVAPTSAPLRPSIVTVAAKSPATSGPTISVPVATIETTGLITGFIQLQSPPTPPMAVYALDQETHVWSMVETTGTPGVAPFSLAVPSGNYLVFAFIADPSIHAYAGYVSDSGEVETVRVDSGQVIADVVLRMPGGSNCGYGFGVPASPDGRYAAMPGPSADCIATEVAGYVYEPLPLADCQTFQAAAKQALGVDFALKADAGFVNPLDGEMGKGCSIKATGTIADFPDADTVIAKLAVAFPGWTERPRNPGNVTSAATFLTRDQAMMFVHANWWSKPGVDCPSDKPITACGLKPEQTQYTVEINVAQKK